MASLADRSSVRLVLLAVDGQELTHDLEVQITSLQQRMTP